MSSYVIVGIHGLNNKRGRVGSAFLPTGLDSNGGQTMKLFAHPTRLKRDCAKASRNNGE